MSAHIDSFLDYLRLERAYSPRTVQSYGMDLNEFEAYLRRTDAELTLETVDAVCDVRSAPRAERVDFSPGNSLCAVSYLIS